MSGNVELAGSCRQRFHVQHATHFCSQYGCIGHGQRRWGIKNHKISLAGQFGDRLARLRELKANDRPGEIVMRLKDMVSVAGTDEGLLTFTVTADDPVLASDLANAVLIFFILVLLQ